MSGHRVSLVLLCALLSLSRARRSSSELEDVEEKVNSARCSSRCLTLHMTQLTAAFRHVQNDQVLPWCENHRRCTQCLQPCKELWDNRKVLSPKSCEKQTECVTSREFLASLTWSRQGDCPPPQRATGFAAACVESCSSDQHCPSSRKCCSNGCGHTCQAPSSLYKGVPLKPRREMSFMEDSQGRVRVMWVSKFNVSVEPVVYMLQSRWNVGIHPSEDHASPWATIAMTLSEESLLSDLRSQRWYQFRVAAINSQGTRGFTTPSKHYISNKDPSPPEQPFNLRLRNQTVDIMGSKPSAQFTERSTGSDVTVSTLLNWDPPKDGDLPVHNYRITWTSRHMTTAHKHTLRAHREINNMHTHLTHTHLTHTHLTHTRHQDKGKKEMHSRLTQGSQCEVWLQGLQPATPYLLSVQAVAYWGQKRLKSPRAQLGFNTITHSGEDFSNELPSSSSSSSPSSSSSSSPSSSSDHPSTSSLPPADPRQKPGNLRLEVASPHYHDNQLQVKTFWKWSQHTKQKHVGSYTLRWRPHSCTSNVSDTERTTTVQGTHHTITGLLFACKYQVSVSLKDDLSSETSTWVTTPTCSSIRVRGLKPVPCNTEERPLQGRKVILRPERLTAHFQQLNNTLLTTFRWRMSQQDHTAVQGFQFTWTLLSDVTMVTEGREDALISQTQTIASTQRSVTVPGLHPDSVYQLHIQVLTTGGGNGAAVSKTIHTPPITHP